MDNALVLNLFSPITLAFALGVTAKLVKSEFSIPKDLYQSLAIYLMLAIGVKGGVELSRTPLAQFAWPAAATLFLGVFIPVVSYLVLRKLGHFSVSDSAGIAAHYGSVSAVTFIAAQQFVAAAGTPAEGFMPTLLAMMESPGIHVALAIGALQESRAQRANPRFALAGASGAITEPEEVVKESRSKNVLHHVLTGPTMILLIGGLLIGWAVGERGWHPIQPFFEGGFKGALTLFLLEMGLAAGERLKDIRKVGGFLLGFGIGMPIIYGTLGAVLGAWSGLSVGGATVLGAAAASASYIAAPPAVRLMLPNANPGYYLTLALGITFPFNLLVGIPLYHQIARWISGFV